MSKKIEITVNQAKQFNHMLHVLKKISKQYMTPAQIRRHKDTQFIGFDEHISLSYENIQGEARTAVHRVSRINIEE